jgi:AraC-like DNA-binding protein
LSELHGRSSDTGDPLSEVLADLRLARATYCRCELGVPWGIEFPGQTDARFHFVAEGKGWLRARGGRATAIEAGDVLLLPRGEGHALADRPGRPTRQEWDMPLEKLSETTYRMRGGGKGARTVLLCCSVGFEEPAVHPLLELMPEVLHLRGRDRGDATLPVLLEIMAGEVLARRVGAATVATRLADIIVTRVIRAWTETRGADATGWLAALRDPKIGRALAAIHRRPGHPWSVDSLAGVARSSRSVFAERFAAVVGVSPARYLARWRMHLAAVWLQKDRLRVSEVASRLGYDSEAAFSRAFKRFVGRPPSAVRRERAKRP